MNTETEYNAEYEEAKGALQEFALRLAGELMRMDCDEAKLQWFIRRIAEHRRMLIQGGLTEQEADIVSAGLSVMVRAALELGQGEAVH